MKVLRQVQLFLQEGTADKVYEIDLLEVSPGACVVNFRFGRRGTPLRDGTKTALAVEPAKAQKIFDSLLAEKRGKGYREAGEAAAGGPKKPRAKAAESPQESLRRADGIVLRRFDQTLANQQVDRLIWRCGERRLADSLARLLELAHTASGRRRPYCLAWAFGRIGHPRALPALEILCRAPDPPTAWIAANARLLLLDEETGAREAAERLASWPPELAAAASAGSDELLAAAAEPWLVASHWDSLQELYLADRLPAIRRLLLRMAARAPLQAPGFRPLRRLFKAAELRCDGELFALLARRFEKEPAHLSWHKKQKQVYFGFQIFKIAEELAKPHGAIGYTRQTRTFLRLRAARALRKLGELRDPAFLPMAASLLLSYTDQDAGTPRAFSVMNWDTEKRTTFHVDAWLIYWSLAFLLYQNSPRYEAKKKGGWRCQPNYKPGKAPPMAREEAFPELWDAAPEALFHLLEESRCAPVHEFAAKALAQNRAYCSGLEIRQLMTLLRQPYEPTWRLGLRLVEERWAARPEVELLLAVLNSAGEPARAQGLAWLAADPRLCDEARVAVSLLLSPYAELRRLLIDRWRRSPPVATAATGQLMAAALLGLSRLVPEDGAAERAADAASAILLGFGALLGQVDDATLGTLLGHPLAEVQQLAGRILAEHLPVERLSSDLIARLLAAESSSVRAQGVVVLSRLPLADLPDAEEVLLAFCVAKESEIRQAARFLVRNLQRDSPGAAGRLATALSARLLRADRPAGHHADLLPILRDDLAPSLPGLGREMALRLLFARGAAAQEVGFAAVNLAAGWSELSVRELARLAQHEMAEVRAKSWETLEAEEARVRVFPTELIPAIDGAWADSRERGQLYFEQRFSGRDFDPVLLVALCDAVTPEARAFGREMLRRHFDGAQAETYLLRLAQHPSLDVQLFASGLLETHAHGKPELLEKLLPFCGRVLARVYQGRAAKTRVFAFLHREALASETAARLVLPLLENISATIAIDDRAACLLALRDLRLAHPSLRSPLRSRPLEERAG